MILNTVVLALSLLAVSVSGSSIKGRSEEYASKGGRQLVGPAAVGYQLRPYNYEQQQQHHQEASYATKGQEVRRTDEASQEAPVEQAKLATDSEHAYQAQQREETKSERQQFYEAQPQLRTEEQTRLVHYTEQTRLDDSSVQQRQQVATAEAPKYEARPQVREEAQSVSVVATAAVPVVAAKGAVYSKTTEERREEQVQYASAAGPQQAAAQPEQRKLVEEVQRVGEIKGQRAYGEESAKASQVSKAAAAEAAATVQRIEEQKFEQQQQQEQAVELTKQEHYEQRRFEEQTEQRSDEQVVQVREETAAAGLKGGLRAAGAEAEPYAFDYSVEGSSRRESGDQYGVVRGQYTIQNPDGSQRVVDYVADRDGFRAQVQSNEFGSEAQQAAQQRSSQQPQQAVGDFARLDTKSAVYAPAPVPVAPVVVAAPAAPVAVAAPAAFAIKSVPQQSVQVVAAAAPAPAVVPEVIRAKASYAETSQQFSDRGPYKAASVESTSYQDEGQQRVYIAQELVQQASPTAYKGRQVSVSNTDSGYRSPKSAFRSAELRAAAAPESILEPLLARASSFESATAHRPVVHSHPAPVSAASVVRHVVPASSVVPVVRHHLPAVPVAPGRRDRHPHPQHQHYRHHSHQQPSSVVPVSVSRAQLQHDRYPPTLRRHDHLASLNPRISFYANGNNNNNFDDEQPAGFEHPAEPAIL